MTTADRTRWKYRVIGRLGSILIRLLGRTWRIRELDSHHEASLHRRGDPLIYSFWHDGMLIPAFARRGSATCVLISRHGDGELIAQVILRLGFTTERGSTTRGGPGALRRMARLAEHDLAITPDGPKGPRHQAQPGVVALGEVTGRTILPVGLAAAPAWRLKSWDAFCIPKPFARVCIAFGEPIDCSSDMGEAQRDLRRGQLEERMRRATERAEESVASPHGKTTSVAPRQASSS